MATPKSRSIWAIVFVAAAIALTLFFFLSTFHAAAATSFTTPSPFKQGGTNNTQIIPVFPTWSVNIPLATPTNFAAASSTSPGGSLATSSAPLYFEVVAINSVGTTTVSNELSTTTKTGSSRIHLTWTPVQGATGYAIFMSTTSPGAENFYQLATSTNGTYDLTSTSTPNYATPPGFPTAFSVQLTNGANPVQVNGVNVSPLATTTAAIGGSALTAGQCLTATSTFAFGALSSTTAFLTTPQANPKAALAISTYALNSTQAVTQICALNSVTPVSTGYNLRAF